MIMFIGMLMVIDGIWSLVTAYNTHYPVCPWYFDAGRVIRAGVGAALIVLSLLLRFQYEIAWANARIKNEPKNTVGDASWYSQRHFKRVKHTASGEPFNEKAFTCAMRGRDFGRYYKVTNPQNNKSVIVKHNDFGPARVYSGRELNRAIDLSKAAFQEIADLRSGVVTVIIEPLLLDS